MLIHLKNENEFQDLVNGKRVLVDFFASWCGPCKMLAPELEELASLDKELTIVKIDVDQFNSLAAKFNIRSVPTMIYFENGQRIKDTSGFLPVQSLINFVR